MKKLTLLLAGLIIGSNVWAEIINGFEIEPITCIAALSIGRDSADLRIERDWTVIEGNNDLLRFLTDVQNNIYVLLPDLPKYDLILSKKTAIIETWSGAFPTELIAACVVEYQ